MMTRNILKVDCAKKGSKSKTVYGEIDFSKIEAKTLEFMTDVHAGRAAELLGISVQAFKLGLKSANASIRKYYKQALRLAKSLNYYALYGGYIKGGNDGYF